MPIFYRYLFHPVSALLVGLLICSTGYAVTVEIGYLGQKVDRPPALANIDERPDDEGLAGALLAIQDNNTTGKFTGQAFRLMENILDEDGDIGLAVEEMKSRGIRFLVLDLEAEALHKVLKSPSLSDMLLFNANAPDRRFRDENCHPLLLHTALSRDMRTDALAQYLVKKRWKEWFLIVGPRPEDALFADSVIRSARKFGAKIVEQKSWTGDHDIRRTAQGEMPAFTKVDDYDVAIVADESGDFGDYVLYQTWHPRPVAGTQGLVAESWGRPIEQWGAAQLQERFIEIANRWMRPRDYAVWMAVRAVGEAALRTNSGDFEAIHSYLRSDKFQLAAFKGRKLSFRGWNGQLRQPVPLLWARSLVAQAPVEGFLHRHSELDTLGLDRPESNCNINKN